MNTQEANDMFHAMIDSIKDDNVEELQRLFEEKLSEKIFYLHFTIPKDMFLPLQPFLFDISAAINSEKCTAFIANFNTDSLSENNEEEDVEEEIYEVYDDNNGNDADSKTKNADKSMNQKEEDIIDIPEDDIDTRTFFSIVTDYEGECEIVEGEEEEEECDSKDNFVSLTDWYVRTNFNEDDYPETVYDNLYVASSKGLLSIVEYLLSYGVNASRISKYGTTVLNGAVFKQNYDLIELFDDYYVKQTADKNGRTPLHISAKLKDHEMTEFLLELGGDPSASDWRGFTPLHISAKNGYVLNIEVLVDYGALIDKPDQGGRTPLHIAALYGQYNACVALYELGATVEAIDLNGMTPMNLATLREKKQVIRFFDSIGVNNTNMESDQYHRKRKSNKEVFNVQIKKNRQNF